MAGLMVQVVSKRLIKPSKPTPRHFRNLKLSLFDQVAPPVYGNLIFYYLGDRSKIAGDTGERCGLLEKSLSDVLTIYYPLAGRFVENDVSIDCSDQGVDYIEAIVNKQLLGFLQDVENPNNLELVNKFLPWNDVIPAPPNLATSPQLAIQINTFVCGGVAVGVRISHIIADAFTFISFINQWAKTSRFGINQVLSEIPSNSSDHRRHYYSSVFPAVDAAAAASKIQLKPKPRPPLPEDEGDRTCTNAKLVTRRFLFDEAALAKIKNRATAGERGSSVISNFKPTKVVLLQAFIWEALMDVSVAKHGHLRDSVLTVPINMRGKLHSEILISERPRPQPPCGNFVMSLLGRFTAKGRKVELADLIILLQNTIRERREKLANASANDISTMLMNSRKEFRQCLDSAGRLDLCMSTSFCNFPKYEADFGWGRPYWVSLDAGGPVVGFVFMDKRDGDGVEAWLTFKEEDMELLQQKLEHNLVPYSKL